MVEVTTQNQTPSEEKGENTSVTPSPILPETTSLIERAEAAGKKIEEERMKFEQLVARNEALAARMMLSGKAEAGSVQNNENKIQEAEEKKKMDALLKSAGYR